MSWLAIRSDRNRSELDQAFCNDVDFAFGQPMEHFQGTGEVELCGSGEDHEANVERGHAVAPGGLKRARNSVGVAEIALENARSMRRRDPNPHRIATLSICASVSSRARLA